MISSPHAPHARAVGSIGEIMHKVMLALVPATLFSFWTFGWPAFWLWLVTMLSAAGWEAVCIKLAGKNVATKLRDESALLTGWLLALSLPPWAPWWIGVVGSFIAIVLAKQVFGGLGQNPFNPAMVARVALLISFPVPMTQWVQALPLSPASVGFWQGLQITFGGLPVVDGVASASVLGGIKTELARIGHLPGLDGLFTAWQSGIGLRAGSLGESSALLILLGGLWLMRHHIIGWRTPVGMLAGVAVPAVFFWLLDSAHYASPLVHLLSGGLWLGAFFIATDPVSSPTTRTGQLIYGIGCGALTYIIRTWGGYPEGVAFAVLLMNAITPLLGRVTTPRIYGRTRDGNPLEVKP
ncbi:electron transport complex protein RnfD [Formivibrio citricus]|uniref:Ion-translocating oxidoreductase complex subunit D n=1 Tax=Formivibrio citricus TaxID=83765 RepID=A0A1I4YXP0_9NEIS|nr:RnfABCDGE type electron transport complex subunit D [Formivibrio citricus]SFN42410.1 electron transport complex protein RnfD [Formivibrio citricus]